MIVIIVLIADQWGKINFFLLTNMLNKNIIVKFTNSHTKTFTMEDTSGEINNFLFTLFILGNNFLSSLTNIQIAKDER